MPTAFLLMKAFILLLLQINGGDFFADTKSAGAVCLLAQIALPVALFAPEPLGKDF